jgi:hypothetical protein
MLAEESDDDNPSIPSFGNVGAVKKRAPYSLPHM